jgi:hypothetical protein
MERVAPTQREAAAAAMAPQQPLPQAARAA